MKIKNFAQRTQELAQEILKDIVEDTPEYEQAIILENDHWYKNFPNSLELYLEALRFLQDEGAIDIHDIGDKVTVKLNWEGINKLCRLWFTDDLLVSGDLSLDTVTHAAVFGNIKHGFIPTSQRYRLLELLLRNKGKLITHEEIAKQVLGIGNKSLNKDHKDKIYEIIKDLKDVFKIPKENKNIFFGKGGYMIKDR